MTRPRHRSPLHGPAVLLLALASTGLAFPGAAGAAERPPDVLLVSVDTLRADALSAYGYESPITPTLDALAERGVLHEDTLTTIGKTGPAFASLFSLSNTV